MITALVILGALLAVAVAYLVVVLRQVRSLTLQLERHLAGTTRTTLTVDLVSRDLETLAARINDAVLATRTANVRSRRDETQFRALITDISHDLRTPLTAVRGYQQLLERSDLDPDQRARLAVAQRHAAELETLVERLYEHTYLLDAEPRIVVEELDAAVLVGEALLAATQSLEQAQLDVRFEPTGPVPAATDREKLTRIVQNLIRNAAQHGRGQLEIGVVVDGDQLELTCANGIAPGTEIDAERLFERFYTADSSRSGRTTGLGLSIVRVLARQLGGDASAAVADGSEAGPGAGDSGSAGEARRRLVLTVRIPRHAHDRTA